MAFHVLNTSLSGLGRFSISLHWWFWAKMAFWQGPSSRSTVKLLNLRHPYVFVSYVSQFDLKIELTYTCKCSHIQQGWIGGQGGDRKGSFVFSSLKLQNLFPNTGCISVPLCTSLAKTVILRLNPKTSSSIRRAVPPFPSTLVQHVKVRSHVHHEVQLFQPIWLLQHRKGEPFAFQESFYVLQTHSNPFQPLPSGQPPDFVVQQEIRICAFNFF